MPSNADRAREGLSTVFGGDLDNLDRYYEDRFQDHVNTMEFSGLDGSVMPRLSTGAFPPDLAKIVECWDSFDSIELLKQLGVWRSLLMFVREWRALLSLRRAERPPPRPETA